MTPVVDLHVQRVGDSGTWVVCVHSSGLLGKQWLPLIRSLRERHRCVVPDLIGYGSSPGWPDDARPFLVADEIAAIGRAVGELDGPVHLVGHSYGGFLALELARIATTRDPGWQIASVSVFEPTVWGVLFDDALDHAASSDARVAFQSVLDGPLFADEHAGDEAWMRGFIDFWNGDGTWDALTSTRQRLMLATGPKTAREVHQLSFDKTRGSDWAAITAPVLGLVGSETNPLERNAMHRLVAALPSARLVEVAGGHMAPIQNAAEVNEHIVEHIAAHDL